jgi:small conductance mechanosensitive channel
VEAIELMCTTLTHGDRSRVLIPNRKLIGEVVHNYGTIRQCCLTVGVAYDSNLSEVFAVIRDILKANPRVMKEIAPGIGIARLGESTIEISITPWASVDNYGAAQSELYKTIVERFRDLEIGIPVPQREIRVLNPGALAGQPHHGSGRHT